MSGFIGTPNGNLGGGAAPFYPYSILYSCRFYDDDAAYTGWTPGGAEANLDEVVFSTWVKRSEVTANNYIFGAGVDDDNRSVFYFDANDKITFLFKVATVTKGQVTTDMIFRDVTNWYHLLFTIDTAQAAAADRINIYVNGTSVDLTHTTNITQNQDLYFGKANEVNVGDNAGGGGAEFSGYQAETHHFPGQSVQQGDFAITDFGEFYKGVWRPKKLKSSASYGTYGFYLDYAVAPGTGNGAGTDVSGLGNHLTDVNLAAADQVVDTPTENYCTLSSIYKNTNLPKLHEGNLLIGNGGVAWYSAMGTLTLPPTGKWYWEVHIGADDDGLLSGVRSVLVGDENIVGAASYPGNDTESWGIYCHGGPFWDKYTGAAGVATDGGSAANDVLQIAVDVDAGKIWFGINDTYVDSGDPAAGTNEAYSGLTGLLCPQHACNQHSTGVINFGQLGFVHTPPRGFLALNTTNIAAANSYPDKIMNPTFGFDTIIYAGDDGATQAITAMPEMMGQLKQLQD
jgi:hypothetical protein